MSAFFISNAAILSLSKGIGHAASRLLSRLPSGYPLQLLARSSLWGFRYYPSCNLKSVYKYTI